VADLLRALAELHTNGALADCAGLIERLLATEAKLEQEAAYGASLLLVGKPPE
jgi:hypothetical protein